MANRGDSTIQFFKKASPDQWTYVLNCYKEAVGAKAQLRTKKGGPEQYIKLDTWYQESLPKTVRGRKEPHLEYNELVDIMKWKLMRTKYKPASLDLVKTNTEKNVKATTQRAFKRMPKLDYALQALTAGLKGIGTATASAILAAAYPDYAPYMAEECMVSTPDVEAEDYTQAEYLKYADHYQKFAQKLAEKDPKGDWNPHKVELAIWSHYVLRLHKPELLDKMPGQVESNGCDDESNQGPVTELDPQNAAEEAQQTANGGLTSSCDDEDEDSQQSNGTLGQDDNSNSSSLPAPPSLIVSNGGSVATDSSPAIAVSQQDQQLLPPPITAGSVSVKNGHTEAGNTTDNDTRSSLADEVDSQDSQSLLHDQPSQQSDLDASQDSCNAGSQDASIAPISRVGASADSCESSLKRKSSQVDLEGERDQAGSHQPSDDTSSSSSSSECKRPKLSDDDVGPAATRTAQPTSDAPVAAAVETQ